MSIKISLSQFVGIVSCADMSNKLNEIRKIKNQKEYSPQKDYYKQIREYICNFHKSGKRLDELTDASNITRNGKKTSNYDILIEKYRSFLEDKNYKYIAPSHQSLVLHGVEVTVRPDIGLELNGAKYLLKLHFKKDEPSKQSIDIITYMMQNAFKEKIDSGIVMAVLDIRNSELYTIRKSITNINLAIKGELAYIAAVWDSL